MVLQYFGPDPERPARWLAFSLTLVPRRADLHALPSRDLRRVAVWSDCRGGADPTLLTFEPGQEAIPFELGTCAHVHWVGSDGTLLAQVASDGDQVLDISAAPLALVRPDGRVDSIHIDIGRLHGVNEVLSDGRALVISGRYDGPLYVVDLLTAKSTELVPTAGRLLTDAARQRLAFRAQTPSGASVLWAGAFPH